MKPMQIGQRIALVAGMIFIAVLGFNITTVFAHGHGGGGGGGHHAASPHEHYNMGEHTQKGDGADTGSYYQHSHDDYGNHKHHCRTMAAGESAGPEKQDPSDWECQNHDGDWEPSQEE